MRAGWFKGPGMTISARGLLLSAFLSFLFLGLSITAACAYEEVVVETVTGGPEINVFIPLHTFPQEDAPYAGWGMSNQFFGFGWLRFGCVQNWNCGIGCYCPSNKAWLQIYHSRPAGEYTASFTVSFSYNVGGCVYGGCPIVRGNYEQAIRLIVKPIEFSVSSGSLNGVYTPGCSFPAVQDLSITTGENKGYNLSYSVTTDQPWLKAEMVGWDGKIGPNTTKTIRVSTDWFQLVAGAPKVAGTYIGHVNIQSGSTIKTVTYTLTNTGNLNVDKDGDGHYPIGACIAPSDDCDDNDRTRYPGVPEICDGKDNNCNGQTDEGFDVGLLCSAGVGECRRDGQKVCNAAKTGTVCGATPGAPSIEVCDGFDNDCNGLIDDNIQPKACYDGPPGTEGVGICKTGLQSCSNGQWGTCIGEVTPVKEICGDGMDNDCNGPVDDGCAVLEYISGNGQEGLICEMLKEPFVAAIENPKQGGGNIDWQITGSPSGSTPSIPMKVTTVGNTEIISSATMKLGSMPGSYTAEATCSECSQGSPQQFQATAKCPDVPVYYQRDYKEPYDEWCFINNNQKIRTTCQKDDEGHLKAGYTQFSISDLGCVLSCASMVMRWYEYLFNGVLIDPVSLNDLMKNISDGYINGDFNFDKVQYATTPALLAYKRDRKDGEKTVPKSEMDGYLEKCIPIIATVFNKTTGHYHSVVVTKKIGDDYAINDPGYKVSPRIRLSDSAYDGKIYAFRVLYNRKGRCEQ